MVNVLTVKDLSIWYKKSRILCDVNLTIQKEEIVFFLGKNGSGKSTLLRSILGLHTHVSGEIKLYGKDIDSTLIAKKIGYVPQYSGIDRDFPITVREIMNLSCRNRSNCSMRAIKNLKYLDSEGLIDKPISELSGGQFQKILIARSLINDPEIIFLDEPFNNLDSKTRDDLELLIINLNKNQKKTIVVVEHDNSLVSRVSEANKVRKFLFDNKNVTEVEI